MFTLRFNHDSIYFPSIIIYPWHCSRFFHCLSQIIFLRLHFSFLIIEWGLQHLGKNNSSHRFTIFRSRYVHDDKRRIEHELFIWFLLSDYWNPFYICLVNNLIVGRSKLVQIYFHFVTLQKEVESSTCVKEEKTFFWGWRHRMCWKFQSNNAYLNRLQRIEIMLWLE